MPRRARTSGAGFRLASAATSRGTQTRHSHFATATPERPRLVPACSTQTWKSSGASARRPTRHFFNHQKHHRGQVTTLLKQLGHDPGVTDLIFILREAPPTGAE
ncbi:MAG: hypothetical protein KC657_39230 [Myxococcales bacterium]|nr:hypothetical protein [Myxococcales bacterium]